MGDGKYVKVAVKGVSYHFDIEYSYLLPKKFENDVFIGTRVEVPFGRGNRKTPAIVLYIGSSFEVKDNTGLKSVAAVLDRTPLLDNEALKIIKWLKDTTFCTYYDAVKSVLPAGIDLKTVVSYAAVISENEADLPSVSETAAEIFKYLAAKGAYVKHEKLYKDLGLDELCTAPEQLIEKGYITKNTESVRKIGDLSVLFASITKEGEEFLESGQKLTQKQRSVLELLFEVKNASVKELCGFASVTSSVITAISKKGLVNLYERQEYRRPKTDIYTNERTANTLNAEQNKAYSTLKQLYLSEEAKAALLYGVTGSGKTQVYLKIIEDIVSMGKGVIIMVPEISLTAQALSLFYSKFGDKVAVFHSALSAGERIDEWQRVKNGEASIALGTRSAVFAPVKNLGLIVIDEEQEHTYKSEMAPKYHAREVAKFRVVYNNALLLLCSATPSVETFKNAKDGKYSLVTLKKRYGGAVLPKVITVDTSETKGALSNVLYDKLENCLKNKKQAILLINRRGFNTFARCTNCKRVALCPNCSIALTYHRADSKLMCHSCGYVRAYTNNCEYCKSGGINYYGTGTQKVEDELEKVFPSARILRMDADTTGARYSYENKLNSFSAGEYDILVGTQMVAKGLNFPNVMLVGVISVDRELYNDDFRSAERAFALLTQVVGRSGRSEAGGEAVIQSVLPDNEIILLAANQDYDAFYKTEIVLRKTMVYPPFCDICTMLFYSESEAAAHKGAKNFFDMLVNAVKDEYKDIALNVLGPIKPRIDKLNNKYRYKITVKCKNNKRFRQMMSYLIIEYNKKPKRPAVALSVDYE